MAGALRSEEDKLVLVRQIDHRFHMYGAVGITFNKQLCAFGPPFVDSERKHACNNVPVNDVKTNHRVSV